MAKHSKSKDESTDDSLYNSSEGEQINDQVNEEVEEEDEEELEAVARPVDSDEDDSVGSGDDQEDDDNNNEIMDFQPGKFLNVKLNFSGMEVNVIRPFVTGSLQTFYKLDDPELIPESDRKENRRPQAANRGPRAELCPNESCTIQIHQYCLKTKFSDRRVERICPGCRTEWPYVVPKAEAVEQEEHENEPPQTQSPAEPSLRKRVRRSTGVEEDSTASSPPPPTESSTRKNLRSSRVVEEEANDNFGGPSQPTTEPASRRLRSLRVVKEEVDLDSATRKQPPSQPLPRKKSGSSKGVEIDTDGSGPSQGSTVLSDSRRTTQSSARLQTAS